MRYLPVLLVVSVIALGFGSTIDPKLETWCGVSALGLALISALYLFTKDDKNE